MHPIRRELEFSLFRATSVPGSGVRTMVRTPGPACWGRLKETAGWAPRARPRGRPGPREGRWGRVPAPQFRVRLLVCAFAARVFRIGYPLRRRVRAYRCRARGCRAGSLFRLS